MMLCWSVGAGACDRRLQNARFKFSIYQHEQSVSFNCRLMTINECCFTIISILLHEEDVFCHRGSEQRKLSVQNTSQRGLKQAFQRCQKYLGKLLQYLEDALMKTPTSSKQCYTLRIYYDQCCKTIHRFHNRFTKSRKRPLSWLKAPTSAFTFKTLC